MKKFRIGFVFWLMSLTLIGVGFSSWVTGSGELMDPAEITTEMGAIVSIDARKMGITVDSANIYLEYAKYNHAEYDEDGNITSSSSENIVLDLTFGFILSVDIYNGSEYGISSIDYIENLYLKIDLGIFQNSSLEILTRTNVLENCLLSPYNLQEFYFEASESTTEYNTFYFPIKSKSQISLYRVALIDNHYSQLASSLSSSKIQVKFKFKSVATDSTLESYINQIMNRVNNITYRVGISLSNEKK